MKNLRNLLKKFTVVTLLAALLFSKPLKTISPYTNINNIILNGSFFSEIDEFYYNIVSLNSFLYTLSISCEHISSPLATANMYDCRKYFLT